MANGNGNNSKDGVKPYVPVLVAIISTFGLTVGGNYILVRDLTPEVIAPDRFTGAEGRSLEQRLDALERDILELRRLIDRLPPRELTERVLRLELEVAAVKKEIERLSK